MGPARKSNPAAWDRAMEALDRDPNAGARLVDELAAKPRPANQDENAMLLHRRISVANEHERARRDFVQGFKEKADAIDMARLEARADDLLAEIDKTDKVINETGTEAGRAFQFRKQFAKEDFSLAHMLLSAKVARGGRVDPQQDIAIAGMHADIVKKSAAVEAAEAAFAAAFPSGSLKPGEVGKMMDHEAYKEMQAARVAEKRAQGQFDTMLAKERLSQRSLYDKIEDFIIRFRKMEVISSLGTLAKIGAASGWRLGITPFESAAGSVWKNIPGFSKIAAMAPREGAGFNTTAEAKAFGDGITKGFADAWEIFKTGKSEADWLHGTKDFPRDWMSLVGESHAAAKAPAVRAEMTRSFINRMDSALAKGVDVTHPEVMLALQAEAYQDSLRSKFQQANRAVTGINNMIANFRAKDASPASRGLGLALELALPVKRIPTNLVAEAMQYATGLFTGNAQAILALRRGVETLRPEQAESIMRQLKKGSIGAAVMALGYYGKDWVGGYFSKDKRPESDVKEGAVRTPYGDISSTFLHNPLLEILQFGATVRRAEISVKKGEQKGLLEGIMS